MSRESLSTKHLLILLLVVVTVGMAGCLDMVNFGDPVQAQGEGSPVEEVQVENTTENIAVEGEGSVEADVSSSVIRTNFDGDRERVTVELIDDIDADMVAVEFSGDVSAFAALYERGDRVVLSSSSLDVTGEAEDLTRELYGTDGLAGGPGAFAGVSYGDNVTLTASAFESGNGELIFEETSTVGDGDVGAQVDYLFDSSNNEISVILANNINADYVDVEFGMGETIAKARLHEVGDEVRISSDHPRTDTYGSAEDLLRKELSEAVETVSNQRRNRPGELGGTGEVTFDEIVSQLSGMDETPRVVDRRFNLFSKDIRLDNEFFEERNIDGQAPDDFMAFMDGRVDTANIFDSEDVSTVSGSFELDTDETEVERFNFTSGEYENVTVTEIETGTDGGLDGLAEDLDEELDELEEDLRDSGELGGGERALLSDLRNDVATLRSMERDLRIPTAGDVTLNDVEGAYRSYRGPIAATGDITDFASVLNNDIFDISSPRGTDIIDDDFDASLVSAQYTRPGAGDLVDITATAVIEGSTTSSGVVTRGGLETTVLDTSASFDDRPTASELEDLEEFFGAQNGGGDVDVQGTQVESVIDSDDGTQVESTAGDGNGSGDGSGDGAASRVSVDAGAVANTVHEALSDERAEIISYRDGFETSYQMNRAAQERADTLARNIDASEEIDALRSGSLPGEASDTNRIHRFIRSGASECSYGGPSYYNEGDHIVLTEDINGIVERAGTTSTTVNLDGMAPVRVPNYALPMYDATSDWRTGDENTEAFVYSELVEDYDGDTNDERLANAIVEEMDTTVSTDYDYQGIGISADSEAGVVYVVQTLC